MSDRIPFACEHMPGTKLDDPKKLASILYVHVSIPALEIRSSVPSFQIPYICINIQYVLFSVWLTSLCIVGSRFTHLTTTDSNSFLLWMSMNAISTTQEKTLHMDITRWSIPKSDWLYSLQPRWRSSIQSATTRPGADYGSDHELFIAKFRLKLKKVEKTTRPFRYDLNHPWTAKRSNKSILKEISPGISLEGMKLKLKL